MENVVHQSNYPDLYVSSASVPIGTVEIIETEQEIQEIPKNFVQFPARSLYKECIWEIRYSHAYFFDVEPEKCVFIDEIQDMSKGIIQVASIQSMNCNLIDLSVPSKVREEKHDYSYEAHVESSYFYSHPLWTMVDFFTEALRFHNITSEPTVKVTINTINTSYVTL